VHTQLVPRQAVCIDIASPSSKVAVIAAKLALLTKNNDLQYKKGTAMKRLLTIILALLMLLAACAPSNPARETDEDLFDQLAETEEQAKERIYNGVKNKLMTDAEKQEMTAEERSRNDALESAMKDALQSGTRGELEQRIAEWTVFADDLREIFSAYGKFNLTPFSDAELSMLSKDELNEYYSYQQKIDEAYFARNVKDLNLLNNQWQSFQSTAKNTFEAARDKMLNDWVSGADLGSSITGLFSLGTIKTTTTVSGHKITVSTQYLTDYGASDAQIRNAMDSYLNLMSSMFQNTVNSLGFYMNDVAIRVEYLNMNGKVVSEKEFKVTKVAMPAGFNPPARHYTEQSEPFVSDSGDNNAAASAEEPVSAEMPVVSTIESGFEVENNNSTDHANEILVGETYHGSLSADSGSEQDWYVFSLEADTVVSVRFTGSVQNDDEPFWDISLRTGNGRNSMVWQEFLSGNQYEFESEEVFLPAGTYYFEVEASNKHTSDMYAFCVDICDRQYVPLSFANVLRKEGYQHRDGAVTSLGEEWKDCYSLGGGYNYNYNVVELQVPRGCTVLELSFAPRSGTEDNTILVMEIYGKDETNLFYESEGITYRTRPITLNINVTDIEVIGIKVAPTEMNIATRSEELLLKGSFYKGNYSNDDSILIESSTSVVSVLDLPIISKEGFEEKPAAVDYLGNVWGRCISLGAFGRKETHAECFAEGKFRTLTILACLDKGVHDSTKLRLDIYGDDESKPLFSSDLITNKSGQVSFEIDVTGQNYLRITVVNTHSLVDNSGDKLLLKTFLE
jgi:hypothetical protein